MLGPVDIADWGFDEFDEIKAALRLLPAVQAIARADAATRRRAPARLVQLVEKLTAGRMEVAEAAELTQALIGV